MSLFKTWALRGVAAGFVAAWVGGAWGQMMPSPIWTDAERIAVFCFVEPDPSLPIGAFEAALCGRAAELLRARVGNVLPVVEIGIAEAAATFSPGTVVALVHARVQGADLVVAGAAGLIVTLTARLMRNHAMLHSAAFFSAPPAAATLANLEQLSALEATLARLIAELLARG